MCWKCGNSIDVTEITRLSTCDECGSDLHSCKNCNFYSPGSHYDCHETIDELVVDKEKSNFCDNFSVKKGDFVKKNDKVNSAREAFNSLFGN
ncbi:MAG: hypothetical protein J6J11_05605 [Treponema sp.]|nr:hypothetical protein [Treponema sp.]